MLKVKARTVCKYGDCKKMGYYGYEEEIYLACCLHKEIDMVSIRKKCVIRKKCDFEGCNTGPNYGYPDEKPSRCKKHILPGMTISSKRKCTEPGCITDPTFGFDKRTKMCKA